MKYTIIDSSTLNLNSSNLVLPVQKGQQLCANGTNLDKLVNGKISKLTKDFKPGSDLGQTSFYPMGDEKVRSITLVGHGDEKQLNNKQLRKLSQSLAKSLKSNELDIVTIAVNQSSQGQTDLTKLISNIVTQIENEFYTFDQYKSKKSPEQSLKEVIFTCPPEQIKDVESAVNIAHAQANGMKVTRDLGNQPGNICTPAYLAEEAAKLVESCNDMSIKVLEEKDMEALNMGAFLSVSKGSSEPGKMIIIHYNGGEEDEAPHMLVGKGITFDTGGISLKPGAQMDEMKYDMCGAASVLGTMTAIAELKPKANYIGIIAAAENMPAGHASKPGDIVTTSSGKTVEILNTDAEGRLVLCDALTYAEQFKPASVIDIATLTGACIIALGHHTSAVIGNDDDLIQDILHSSKEANDAAWQLPMGEEYQEQLDSPFADMQNIGGKGAGTITAACFLSRFTESYKWAHLDIAGTAWISGGKDKGATGRPVPLLLNYLLSKAVQ